MPLTEQSRELVAASRDPSIDWLGQMPRDRPTEDGCEPAPTSASTENLGRRRGASQYTAVRQDELHRLHASAVLHQREARSAFGRLARQQLDFATHHAARDPGHALHAERARRVVDDNNSI